MEILIRSCTFHQPPLFSAFGSNGSSTGSFLRNSSVAACASFVLLMTTGVIRITFGAPFAVGLDAPRTDERDLRKQGNALRTRGAGVLDEPASTVVSPEATFTAVVSSVSMEIQDCCQRQCLDFYY